MPPLDVNAPTAEEAAEIKRRKAAITRRIRREVLAELRLERLPKRGERTLVTGAQGTGKSWTCAETLAELPAGGLSIWWLVPSLEKADEQAGEYNRMRTTDSLLARVVRGRGALDPHTDNAAAMCPRHEVVNRAAAMGVNVQEEICNNGCSLRFSCGFQRQATVLHNNPLGLFVMAADYLWLPCPAPRPDIVIVDESAIAKATERISFDPARIVDDHKWAARDLDDAMAFRATALLVRAAVVEHPGRELSFLRSCDVTDRALKACIDHLFSKEEARAGVDGRMTDKQIAGILDAVEARDILKVIKLFRQVRREFAQARGRLTSVWFDPDHPVMVNGQLERHPRVVVSCIRRLRIRKEVPILCLDGTGSMYLNRKIFGDHMTLKRFAVPRDAEVYQVTSKTFSRQSITGTDHKGHPRSAKNMNEAANLRAQVVEFLSILPGDVLLVSYKAAIEVLLDDLPPHVATAHFGALRGLNSFEHCETVVVMGREQPSAQAIEALTRPFCADDPAPFLPVGDYVPQTRGRRMRDARAFNLIEVQVHFDARCQAVLEQIREAEMVQAIDRVRPVFNRRKIFVLNNLPLDLTVDRALTWSEVRPGKFVLAFARQGVLPLSAVDLPRCFPDLWRSEKAAEDALRWLRKTPGEVQIDSLFGRIRVFFREPVKATYRRKGQRGPLARALVRSSLPNPRAVLEGMVGELTEFHLERPTRSPAEAKAGSAPHPLPTLSPLAAALSAEAHLLATLPADARPPDVLGMARVLKLMTMAGDRGGPERAAAA